MQHQVPPQAAILQVIAGYWLSCADYAAARLKLADKVNGKTSLSAFAQLNDTRPKSLRRLMRALTSHGYFREEPDGTSVQKPQSAALRSDGPASMRAIAEADLGHDHYYSWRAVETCLFQSGTAFERVGRELRR